MSDLSASSQSGAGTARFDFSLLFQTERAMFSVAGTDGFFKEVNPAFERLLGRDRSTLLSASMFEFIVPEDIPKTLQGIADLEAEAGEAAFVNRWLHTDGSIRWLEWVAIQDADSRLWYATARDVTESRRAQEALNKVQARLHLALSVAQAGSWESDVSRRKLTMDAGIEVLIGHPPGQPEAAYAQLLRLVHPKDRRRIVDMLRSAERDKDQLETDFRLKDQSAGTRHIAIRGRIVARDRRARPLQAIGIAFDITNQKTLEEQLLALVMYDSLTGVRNRRSFDHSLRREWNRAGRSRHSLAVLMIDVDYFKLYNDRLGHQAGDDALCAVARALSEALGRETDLLARYGGEEFVALLANATIEQATRIGEHLLASVRALGLPHPASAFECVTVSIGAAALVPGDDVKSHDLLPAADQALYRAKAAGRNRLSA